MIKLINQTEFAVRLANRENLTYQFTYEGDGAWRMRADLLGGATFAFEGDAQKLCAYMGESFSSKSQPIAVEDGADAIVLSAADGSTAKIAKNGSVIFCNKDGKRMVELTSASIAEGKAKLCGTLLSGEGVFGGGQRFDVCNHRGNSLRLFSYDCYNTDNGKGTYMPIPLFYTTCGGGMFFNHYERMNVSFGDAENNTWEMELCKDALDCYFYTKGSYADLLQTYTDMTGKAVSVPTEWMQGVLICRYSPEFCALEVEKYKFDSIDEIPDYQKYFLDWNCTVKVTDVTKEELRNYLFLYSSVGARAYIQNPKDGSFLRTSRKGGPCGAGIKAVVENLIAAGQKPTAMVLEGGFGVWHDCTEDTEKAKKNRQFIKDTVKWLHDQNIRVTVYMSVANITPRMKGYKPEYQLWVEMTNSKGEVTRTFDIPQQKFTDNPDVGARGRSYLDITNPEALDWYLNTIWADVVDLGIEGVKIDFCEMMPEEGVYPVRNEKQEIVDYQTLKYCFHTPDMFTGMNAHHAYPTYFISTFCKAMNEKVAKRADGDGFMVLSRGGAFGSQRNPYLWAGDQTRTYPTLQKQMTALMTSGLGGVPFMTYDMAGYSYAKPGVYFEEGTMETESQIYTRAIEYTAFTPCIQTHGDVRHLYDMTEETKKIASLYTDVHMQLLPLMQKLSKEACQTGMPVVRHLVLNYADDANVYPIEDEFMLGDALLVAPILDEDTFERTVYLPKGSWTNLLTGEAITGGVTVKVPVTMAQIPVFLNNDSADAKDLQTVFATDAWKQICKI
ncbi:MAG: hypothetical protein IJW50_05130 [Clostridia bacterium]|nr:hypothetical protein [Clostridia bacterium]